MTDDADAFIFGAVRVIKNGGLKLSGNVSNPVLNTEDKASKDHVMIFPADAIRSHPEVGLTRGGLILFALLSSGDYDQGITGFGKGIAHALSRCGFGEQLVSAFEQRATKDIHPFLRIWREDINAELRSNSRGFLNGRYTTFCLQPSFPDMSVLENYVHPISNDKFGKPGGGPLCDKGQLDLAKFAGLCEELFGEWGHKMAIIRRFRDLFWKPAVMHVLRRAALEADKAEKARRSAAGIHDTAVRGPLKPPRTHAIGTPAALLKKYLCQEGSERRRQAIMKQPRTCTLLY